MKNFVQDGDVLDLPAPYNVTSGQGALIGALFVVAVTDALAGVTTTWNSEGVHELTALNTDTATFGAKAYWDDTNRRITTTATGNSLVGAFVAAKTNGQTTALIRMNAVTV